MGRYLIRRMLLFIPVFFGATFLIFTLVFLIPGDPIRALAGDRQMSQSTLESLRDRYHLDEPFLKQYWLYTSGIVQGDFGTDFRGREVTEIMSERIPVTFRRSPSR
jgi:oligopeptide transport system permease protein